MIKHIEINEVSPRDGFQIEPQFIPTEDKVTYINQLLKIGFARIEVTSFTSPKAIPALRDAQEVIHKLDRNKKTKLTALVPNEKGAERALLCDLDEINLVMSASDAHGMANLHMTAEQSLQRFKNIVVLTKGSPVFINASLSTAFGCPFSGKVPLQRIYKLIDSIMALGITGITLCDTTGMANPKQVTEMSNEVLAAYPNMEVTMHFHNTRGMGLVNAFAAWQTGIKRFDASLGGLGGCPFAPGATGNVCTEDLVHMFYEMGIDTGVDLDALIPLAKYLEKLVGHDVPGQVMKAGKANRKYDLPKSAY